jgi:hypothetical protein
VIWRYDRDDEQVPDVFGEVEESPILTFPTKVPSDSLGRIGSLKSTSDKSLFPMALGSCGHRITHQLRPINMNGRSILSETSIFIITAYRLRGYPMPTPQPDLRSERRKALDEQLASEPHLPLPDVLPGEPPAPFGDASSPPSPRARCRGGGERGGAPARLASEAARAVASDRRGSRALLSQPQWPGVFCPSHSTPHLMRIESRW